MRKINVRKQIESNGLILIAMMMVVIYWTFDTVASGQILTRILITALVMTYGIFTQSLINSRNEALAEKDRTRQQLIQAEKLAALGAVAAGVAHEVKNPLAIIIQGIEYLKSSLGSDAGLLDASSRIEKSALRADNIVKGLLGYARQITLKPGEGDIVPVIEESLSFVEHQLKDGQIRVEKHFAPDLPVVIMDSNHERHRGHAGGGHPGHPHGNGRLSRRPASSEDRRFGHRCGNPGGQDAKRLRSIFHDQGRRAEHGAGLIHFEGHH